MLIGKKDLGRVNELENKVKVLESQLDKSKKSLIKEEEKYNQWRSDLETRYKMSEKRINSDYQKLEQLIKEKYLSEDDKTRTNLKKILEADLFFNKIYEHFIRDFNDRIENLRFGPEKLNEEDRALLVRYALEIAMHTADYTEHYIGNDEEYQHKNFQLLKNDLSLSKAKENGYNIGTREFKENNIVGSSIASNGIYKACKSLGIKSIRFLVDQFNLNPSLKKE
jgi:hypothetical protein